MTRRRSLTDEQAAQLYAEYCVWLANAPKKLCARYGIERSTLTNYIRRQQKRRAA